MHTRLIDLRNVTSALTFPDDLKARVDLIYGPVESSKPPSHFIVIGDDGEGLYSVQVDRRPVVRGASAELALDVALDQVVRSLITDVDDAVALHAAAVAWDNRAILIAGPTGAGKTTMAGWFAARGFSFLSDEIVIATGGRNTVTFPRPLLTKSQQDRLVSLLADSIHATAVATGAGMAITIPDARSQSQQAGLIVFPRFVEAAQLRIEPLTAARTLMRLMECNLNARNMADHGLDLLKGLAGSVPAIEVTHGGFDQFEGILDRLVRLAVAQNFDAGATRDLFAAFAAATDTAAAQAQASQTQSTTAVPAAIPKARPPLRPKPDVAPRLTIGMATYDDYDGVYFTIQAIRMYHPEVLEDVEFVVVDNNPDGPCGEALYALEYWIPNLRYIPNTEVKGTAVRDFVFTEASGEFVLCIDCHVLIAPGAIARLMAYFAGNPQSKDLIQGPLLYDGLKTFSSHFSPGWRSGMYGRWEVDEAAADAETPPFEIPMQGLGLFACRRAAWPGFNPLFHGFGGEEGYIHEKFRLRGGRVLCAPFLRWVHRFNRPMGIPYRNVWEDRIRNYFIGFREIGWDTAPIGEHFKEHLGEEVGKRIVAAVENDPVVQSVTPAGSK